jgi:hypothetical protein
LSTEYDPTDECPIGLEAFGEDGTILQGPCGHNFHAQNIKRWLAAGNTTCPVCRKRLNEERLRIAKPHGLRINEITAIAQSMFTSLLAWHPR